VWITSKGLSSGQTGRRAVRSLASVVVSGPPCYNLLSCNTVRVGKTTLFVRMMVGNTITLTAANPSLIIEASANVTFGCKVRTEDSRTRAEEKKLKEKECLWEWLLRKKSGPWY
jgi:hypothetical protein